MKDRKPFVIRVFSIDGAFTDYSGITPAAANRDGGYQTLKTSRSLI
jgi:hypothetical protein